MSLAIPSCSLDLESERAFVPDISHRAAIQRSIAYMHENLVESISLDALCRTAAISKFRFIRVFGAVTGVTPRYFLACLRIQRAKELLLQTSMPITDVCMDVGYTSLGSFSSAFHEMVGMAPREFREFASDFSWRSFAERLSTLLERQDEKSALRGIVDNPDEIPGCIFVGAFRRGVPQGVPDVGTVLLTEGEYQLANPLTPAPHLLAVQLRHDALEGKPRAQLPVTQVASARLDLGRVVNGRLPTLTLRQVEPTDPPVLVELLAIV